MLGFVGVLLVTGLAGLAFAAFNAQTASGSSLAFASLDSWLPSAVTTSRATASTCQVSWTPDGSAPVGATYDVNDGTSTLASDVAGTTTVVTVGAGAVTPEVRLRVGTWVSASGTGASSACLGWPDAPVLTVTPSEGQLAATWTAPSGNGSAVVSYSATVTPAGTGTSSCSVLVPAARSCTFTGLTDGLTYTVSVTAANGVGTGPQGSSTAVPYPSTVMSGGTTDLWLDGADPGTLFASPSCSGAPATGTIGCWKDKSASANDAVQAVAANRPVLSTLNGLGAPTFDGVDDHADLSVGGLVTGTAPSAIYTVAVQEDTAPAASCHRKLVAWGSASTGAARFVGKACNSSAAYLGTYNSFASIGTPPSWPTSTAALIDGVITSTGISGVLDGAPAYSISFSNNTGTAGATLGDSPWGTEPWKGRIAELIVLADDPTAAQGRQVEEYLARKWGLALAPRAPTTVTVSPTAAGSSADVAWTGPSWDGGSAVTGYTVSAVPTAGGPTVTCTAVSPATTCTLPGLAGGAAQYTVTVAATNAVGSGPASSSVTLFAGLPVTANLKLWLDGADRTTLFASSSCSGAAATSTVGCWADKSGQAVNASQPTQAARPALTTVAGNSAPSFDGIDDGFTFDASLLPTGASSSSLAAAATLTDPSSGVGYDSVISWGTGNNGGMRQLQHDGTTSTVRLDADGGSFTAVGGTWSSSDATVAVADLSGGSTGHLYVSGTSGVTGSGSYSTTGAAGGIGRKGSSATEHWSGPVDEVIVTSGVLSGSERRSIEEYLARKWGGVITPSAPASPSASGSGTTATISWSAPAWNGGAAVSAYTVSTTGGKSCTTSGTSCQITGLVADAAYTFTVTAANSVGTGPSSSTNLTMPSPAQPIDTFELSVWGYGASGRTGVLMQAASTGTGPAVRMPGPEAWASVSAGTDHTCGITTGGALYCWGDNANGELGVGDTTMRWEPAQVSAGTTWSQVGAGQDNTCAIKATDSSLWCWGYYGASNLTTPTAVGTTGVTTWSTVGVGIQFACGLKTDGSLWCIGNGANGRLGNGSTAVQVTPVQVSGGTTFTEVTTGEAHACAIRASDSAALCWGADGSGQLGDNATVDSSSPVAVSGGLTWSSLSAGESMTCGVTTGSALYCWGANGFGQLGDGTVTDRHVPTRESTSATSWTAVSATFNSSTCATRITGALSCWGSNGYGQLGDGSTTDRHSPTASGSAADWTSVSGGGYGTCGIRSDAAIWCQGYDGDGELGQHYATAVGSPTPVVPFAGPWYSGSAGYEGGCGVQDDGTLWCWGVNTTGWHGTGSTTEHDTPIQADPSSDWRKVSVGLRTACGIRDDGTLYCWGYATDGQTGVTGAGGDVTSPTAGPSDLWSDVSVGETHTCGITTLGLLSCWGENSSGQLGQGDVTDRSTPVAVTAAGVTTWSDVSAGYYSTCAIAASGANAGGLYCWGMNSSGQAGVGSTTVQKSPAQVGSATWSQVAAGRQHTCGVRTDGTLWCWGVNNLGQLGGGGAAGAPATATGPQQVGAGTTWSTVGAGYEFSCATKDDGTLWCWGRNDVSQVGDRTTTTRTSPVQVSGWTGALQEVHGSAMVALAGS